MTSDYNKDTRTVSSGKNGDTVPANCTEKSTVDIASYCPLTCSLKDNCDTEHVHVPRSNGRAGTTKIRSLLEN